MLCGGVNTLHGPFPLLIWLKVYCIFCSSLWQIDIQQDQIHSVIESSCKKYEKPNKYCGNFWQWGIVPKEFFWVLRLKYWLYMGLFNDYVKGLGGRAQWRAGYKTSYIVQAVRVGELIIPSQYAHPNVQCNLFKSLVIVV